MTDFTFTDNEDIPYGLKGLKCINIILGRNGAGKSRFLRAIDSHLAENSKYRVNYVTPERTGTFQRDGNIDSNSSTNPNWIRQIRRANQVNGNSFKAMSHLALRNAETAYLRRLQDVDARGKSFQIDCLEPINRMLGNVFIEQGGSDFLIRTMNGTPVAPGELSSGESETIALASEVMSFIMAVDPSKDNILLLDEPDVHQHPDLQARFGHYLLELLRTLPNETRNRVFIHIATHSTALVCSLANSQLVAVGTKEFENNIITLGAISDNLKKVAPFFGHPLSLSLSNDPILILEGEDDERVWQQAARSSSGRIRVFPVLAQSVDQQSELERFCDKMLVNVYDNPKAYSLRDGDGVSGQIAAIGCVERFRLQCYAIENALVTTECLAKLNLDWAGFQKLANIWIDENSGHQNITLLQELLAADDRLRNTKIKNIRQLIVAISGSNKPWEVVIGQSLSSVIGNTMPAEDPFSLLSFVGEAATKGLLQTGVTHA
ncbi:AAA family ATPase [Janthinobacterium sp. BJB401]|uniref:AAA family ATPase n=1 Tax=Janthinobacterium sp. BJB401 TaxID=2745934 RepID=UPI00159501FD|nr:AAA family ATPase [Janthinobacterium sp. BJB401]NVI82772.1 ATP-binding protein [Janthinobacterium sp. BJB401]